MTIGHDKRYFNHDGKDYVLFESSLGHTVALEAETLFVGANPQTGGNAYVAVAEDYLEIQCVEYADRTPWHKHDLGGYHSVRQKSSDEQASAVEGVEGFGWNFTDATIDPEKWMTLPGETYNSGPKFPPNRSSALR